MNWHFIDILQGLKVKGSSCPACGCRGVRVFDKGRLRWFRMFFMDSRIYCPECRSTWRLKTPERISKIKRKTHKVISEISIYHEIPFASEILTQNHEQLQNQAKNWFIDGHSYVALNMEKTEDFSQDGVGSLMELYVSMTKLGGSLIVCSAPDYVKDYIWGANVTFLIHSDQRIQTNTEFHQAKVVDLDPRVTGQPKNSKNSANVDVDDQPMGLA